VTGDCAAMECSPVPFFRHIWRTFGGLATTIRPQTGTLDTVRGSYFTRLSNIERFWIRDRGIVPTCYERRLEGLAGPNDNRAERSE
jgi:hypothetical protein